MLIDQPFWSIGPKIGYIFGEQGGLTGGFEVALFPNAHASYALTFDVTGWSPSNTAVHVGVEAWLYAGLDIGPTLFLSKQAPAKLGMSVIVWDGLLLYPYYELSIPFDGNPYHSVGGYIKFPIGLPHDYFKVG